MANRCVVCGKRLSCSCQGGLCDLHKHTSTNPSCLESLEVYQSTRTLSINSVSCHFLWWIKELNSKPLNESGIMNISTIPSGNYTIIVQQGNLQKQLTFSK